LSKTGKGTGDGSEQITLHEVPLDGIEAWLRAKTREGAMIDLKVYGGLFFAGVRRGA
jgi:ADP-ribose pyrophosphatase